MENILSNLSAPKRKNRKRVGRGLASGWGKTAGRGTKGQLARAGAKHRAAFEGGQTPLIRRIPKRGFNNPCKTIYETVNIKELEKYEPNTIIDPDFLRVKGIVKSKLPIKILGDGELTKPLTICAHKFSKSAITKIEKAKGKVEEITKHTVAENKEITKPQT